MLLLISEASMVCVTLDVTDATTQHRSWLQASCGVYLVVGSPSPGRGGESGRSGALPAVIHGTDSHWRDLWPIYCTAVGATRLTPVPWTLGARALDDLMCSLPDVARCF